MKILAHLLILLFLLPALSQALSVSDQISQERFTAVKGYISGCMSHEGSNLSDCSSSALKWVELSKSTQGVQPDALIKAGWNEAMAMCTKKFSMTDCLMDFIGHSNLEPVNYSL